MTARLERFRRMVFRPAALWLIGLGLVLLANLVWEVRNEMPPAWDMAHHQLNGWAVYHAWQDGMLLERLPRISTYYPPLYYLQEAVFIALLHKTQFLPFLSNLAAVTLLSLCTTLIGRRFLRPPVAVMAGLLTLLFPLVAWTSRESLLDLPLAGWVAAAGCIFLYSDFMRHRGWMLLLGLVCALGLLTKWTFGFFILPPVLLLLMRSPDRRQSLLCLADAIILATPLIFWWYLPNLQSLLGRFQMTAQAAGWEGDPNLFSFLNWIYYPRTLSSYYLFLPLTLALIWSLVWSFRRRPPGTAYLWIWLGGSILIMTLLEAKDPRYIMPVCAPLAIVLLLPWNFHRLAPAALTAIAFGQFLAVSFAFPFLPEKVALFKIENDGDYIGMRQEWVFFSTHYFQVAGPPRQEDWRIDELNPLFPPQSRVGFVPDLPFFHPSALMLAAVEGGKTLSVWRLGDTLESVEAVPRVKWVIAKTGHQGISWLTRYNQDVYNRLAAEGWPLRAEWGLPDDSVVRVWQNPRPPE